MASFSAYPALASMQPQEIHEGNLTYITGGIGEQSTEALRASKNNYKLRVVNAGPKGAFVGETAIEISDMNGDDVLQVKGGPLFYANLPNGKYKIEVGVQGITQEKTFTISSKKPTDIRFIWK